MGPSLRYFSVVTTGFNSRLPTHLRTYSCMWISEIKTSGWAEGQVGAQRLRISGLVMSIGPSTVHTRRHRKGRS
eukprot:6210082-Pleurochrysis_carterae.AAC.2